MYAYRVTLYPSDGSAYSLTVASVVVGTFGEVQRTPLDAREIAATHGCECIYRHQGPHMGTCLCFRRVEVERITAPKLIDLA